MIITAFGVLAGLAQGEVLALIGGAFYFGFAFVMIRLGKGLAAGERNAVYGVCAMGGLAALAGFICGEDVVSGFIILAFVLVFHGPLLFVAFRHWRVFK